MDMPKHIFFYGKNNERNSESIGPTFARFYFMRFFFVLTVLTCPFQAHSASIWQELREKSLLTDQTSITKRDDLCVAAAAVNLAQGLARQMNRTPIPNPHAVFENFVERHPGVNDDIGLFEMNQVVRSVLDRTFPQDKLKVDAILLDRYTEKNMAGIRSVEKLTDVDLAPALNEAKMLNIDLFDGRGEYIGGHAVVVESLSHGELKFVNSFEPGADSRAQTYVNSGTMWKGHQIPTFKIISPEPADLGAPHAFFVRGVVTVRKAD